MLCAWWLNDALCCPSASPAPATWLLPLSCPPTCPPTAHAPPPPARPPLCLALQGTKPDFSNYDDSGAWPYLLDEFVEGMRKQQQDGQQAAAS